MMEKIDLLNEAQNADYVFISVMGPHANESESDILHRKYDDIKKAGESFWVSRIFEKFIEESRNKLNGGLGYMVLVEGESVEDTKVSVPATQYSEDKIDWKSIDDRISHVTGNLGKGATAYCFDDMELFEDKETPINMNYSIDLNYYCEVDNPLEAIRFRQGKTNVFAKKNETKLEGGMKRSKRRIVAVLRLKHPYVVWVK